MSFIDNVQIAINSNSLDYLVDYTNNFIAKHYRNDPEGVGMTLYNAGNLCLRSEEYIFADYLFGKALDADYQPASVYNNIAATKKQLGMHTAAIENFMKAAFHDHDLAHLRAASLIISYNQEFIKHAHVLIERYLKDYGNKESMLSFANSRIEKEKSDFIDFLNVNSYV